MSAARAKARALVAADRRVKRATKRAFPHGQCSFDAEWIAATDALRTEYRRSAVSVARAYLRVAGREETGGG